MLITHYLSLFFLLIPAFLVGQIEENKILDNQTILKSIFFGGGSSYIDNEQAEALREFIYAVENINRYEVIVNSFTDNIGSREYNQWLSQQRSRAVLEILYQLDIPIDMIFKADFGEDDPIYDNSTFEGQLSNRRVDVILRPLAF